MFISFSYKIEFRPDVFRCQELTTKVFYSTSAQEKLHNNERFLTGYVYMYDKFV